MPTLNSYDYTIIRVVPRVERQEFINAGVIAFSAEKRFLHARIRLNEERLKILWPEVECDRVRVHLSAIERICKGEAEAGPIAKLTQKERFHWLTSARSTMIQPSPVHAGLSDDMDTALEELEAQYL